MAASPEKAFHRVPLDELRAANFLQSKPWAQVKAQSGWSAQAFGYGARTLLLLKRPLCCGYTLAYIPCGLEDLDSVELLQQLRLEAPKAILLRWDVPDSYVSLDECLRREEALRDASLRKAPDIQVPTTVLLDLRRPEEELLSGMKAKTRYNVRLAEKKEVRVTETQDLSAWYTLHRSTAERQKIFVRPLHYYEAVAKCFRAAGGESHVYLAEQGDSLLAGIFVLYWGKTASYLYGGSDFRHRALMAPYALQWHAIRRATAAGMTTYDFCGISRTADSGDKLSGLYRFKTGFGGSIRYRPGCWDLAFRPLCACVFRSVEALRRRSR